MVEMNELQGKTVAELISIIQSQQEVLQEKDTAIQTKTQFISQPQEYIILLKRGRFGSSSERFVDTLLQGCFFNEAELEVAQALQADENKTNDEIIISSHSREKRKLSQ